MSTCLNKVFPAGCSIRTDSSTTLPTTYLPCTFQLLAYLQMPVSLQRAVPRYFQSSQLPLDVVFVTTF